MSERLRGNFPDGYVPPTDPVLPLSDVGEEHQPPGVSDYWPDENEPRPALSFPPHFAEELAEEFNANVGRIFTVLAQVPQRMAAVERERLERQRDDQA